MSIDLGLLVLRVIIGLVLIGHGTQKLFGWFGGPGLKGFSQVMGGHMRMRPASFWAIMGGLSEAGGGLLLVLGLLSPLGSLGLIAAMLMAFNIHWPKFWASEGGLEFALVILGGALALGITGPGQYSLDNLFGIQLPEPVSLIVGLVLVVLGVVTALVSRRPAEQPAAAATTTTTSHAA